MKYEDVNYHNAQNKDSIIQSLNNLALILNHGDYLPHTELSEVKKVLNQAFIDYETLLKSLRLNDNHNLRVKKIYDELIDKERDNLDG